MNTNSLQCIVVGMRRKRTEAGWRPTSPRAQDEVSHYNVQRTQKTAAELGYREYTEEAKWIVGEVDSDPTTGNFSRLSFGFAVCFWLCFHYGHSQFKREAFETVQVSVRV